MSEIKYNTKNLKILTDSGFRNFVGITKTHESIETIHFDFDDGSSIEVTPNHKFISEIDYRNDGESFAVDVHAQALDVGDKIATMDGHVTITNVEPGPIQSTFDIIEAGDNRFKTNSVISHNCEFLSSDPLLIDSMILGQMENRTELPMREDMGWKFWQDLQPQKTYLLGVDPATGTGADFTVMQVYDFQDMSVVAEFRSNTMSSPSIYASLKLMLNKIEGLGSTTYFSVENNGVGEGVIALYENDETLPQNAEFVSEEGANRLGMRTESRAKMRACLTLKRMVESGKLAVKSEELLKEMKSFVAHKGAYAAQTGATDDIICSLLVVIRILGEMVTYEQRAFDLVHDYDEVGSFEETGGGGDDYDDDFEPDGMII